MSEPASGQWTRELPILAWPALVLVGGFLLPFLMLVQMSVAHHDAGGMWSSGFELTSFAGVFNPVVFGTMVYSVALAVMVAVLTTLIALPLTLLLIRLGHRAQVAWLILLLSTLCLSEVLIAFAWQVALAKRVGLSNILVVLGLLSEPVSLSPNFGAMLCGFVYLLLPFSVLQLLPPLSRLDPHLSEAARTMGARPVRVFFDVTLPLIRTPLISSSILGAVSALGAYVTPTVLGGAENWTISVMMGKAALDEGNAPFAAALALCLLVVTVALIALTVIVSRSRSPAL